MEHFGTNFIVSETPYQVWGPGRYAVERKDFVFRPEEGRLILIKAGATSVYIGGYTAPCAIPSCQYAYVTLAVSDANDGTGLWVVEYAGD
jgi:hypothetical protein